MPEGGKHAPILIATSWQALNRLRFEGPDTQLCNSTVVILFAGFYVEANLNHIIEQLGAAGRLKTFSQKRHPGLQDKMAWFYNEFIARAKEPDLRHLYKRGVAPKLRRRFKGFAKLYRFRNDLSHGIVNKSARSVQETLQLRQQAKDIADELFAILQRRGHTVPRDINYYEAIRAQGRAP